MYESRYEQFTVAAPDGQKHAVQFKKAGFLAQGDQPEVYFFVVDEQSVVVGIAGSALSAWQHARRYLSREEKVDIAGRWLHERIACGEKLSAEALLLREPELELLAGKLELKI